MKILICYKLVADEQDITVKSDQSLDTSKVGLKISQFDLNAIEAAVQLVSEVEGSTVTAVSVGGKSLENTKSRKDILSRGVDSLTVVMDERLDGALPVATAQALSEVSQKEGFDLIICGDGSGDLYAQQVGLLLGETLGVSCINAVSKIVSAQEGKLIVERTLENETEVLELTLPAVISVTTDINTPRIPAMKAILAASKKPVSELSAEDLGLGDPARLALLESIRAPKQTERKKIIVEGDSSDQVAELLNHLSKVL